MAQKIDISTSLLVTEGTNVKEGALSILEKKGSKMFNSIDYQLTHLHWRLVAYADRTYLLGYPKTLGGAKATKKLMVKKCSIENMNLPAKVLESPEGTETFLSIRCGEKIIVLKAESKDVRDTWVAAIRSTIKEPITSTISTPDGQMAYRASPPAIAISTQALAQPNRRSQEMASPMALNSQESAFHSLNSADILPSSSRHELNNPGMHIKELKPPLENNYVTVFNEPRYDTVHDETLYMNILDIDDQSNVSRVNNLDLDSEGNANPPHDGIAKPKLPNRNNQNPSIVVQEGLVKKTSIRKTRAPQQPEAHIDQMDTIQREKTVCLETQFQNFQQRDLQPIESDKSDDDNETEMRGKINRAAPNCESIHAYIQRFRSELFQKDGFIVEVDKTDLSPETMKLVCVADCICIATLPNAKLHSLLHVDDVIVKVNRQTLPSVEFCYTLFRTTDENKVQLRIKRVMHGILCHVILSANGDVDSLGLEFGNESQGNEVTSMHSEGLVAKSGSPSRPQTHGVVNGGMLVNWGLVEINQSPVSFDSSPADVRNQIQRSGCELVLVFIPMDLINFFKEGPCGESTDQTSTGQGTC